MKEDNIFKRIEEGELTVPEDLRELVLADIEASKLFMEFADLFSIKYTDIAKEFLGKINESE